MTQRAMFANWSMCWVMWRTRPRIYLRGFVWPSSMKRLGLLGITAASAIGKQVANTRQLYEELLNIEGIASRTAKEMDSGIGGSFRILMSSVEGVAIAIGEALSGPLQQFSDAISGTLSVVIQWIEAIMNWSKR